MSARGLLTALAGGLLLAEPPAGAGEVEVLHFWTSPGEAQSLDELKALIAVRGHTWRDFAVVGGAGGNAMLALQQRVQAGQPPAAASIKGPAIQEWAAQGALANLDAMALFDHWDRLLPPVVQQHVKHRGRYVAVPVNIHRSNWLWSNARLLRQVGLQRPPENFAALLHAAEKLRAAGHAVLAHGGQPWQDFVLFETVALAVGGAEFFRRALVDLSPQALEGAEMRSALAAFRRLKPYTTDAAPGREWNAATDRVIRGEAAFQFMGDWAKGEFVAAGKQAGEDFFCSALPASGSAFSYVIDTFAMFQLRNWEAQKAQGYLAYVLLGTEFQRRFNRRKGSIPVRQDLVLEGFDDCAIAARAEFEAAAGAGRLVPSVAIGMAPGTAVQARLQTVISQFWNDDRLTIDEALVRLGQAAAPARAKRVP